MKRLPFEVALSVFAFSVVSELLGIQLLRGSITAWLNHPHRRLLLVALIVINLLNAAAALYFSRRAVDAEMKLERTRLRQREASVYLNDNLRNALSIVQNAAFLTQDEGTMKLCDDAVARIVRVLVSSEAALIDPSDVFFQESTPTDRIASR